MKFLKRKLRRHKSCDIKTESISLIRSSCPFKKLDFSSSISIDQSDTSFSDYPQTSSVFNQLQASHVYQQFETVSDVPTGSKIANKSRNPVDPLVSSASQNIGYKDDEVASKIDDQSGTIAQSKSINSAPSEVMCRICHGGESLVPDLGELVCVCACRGSVGRQHKRCLERWLTESGSTRCELCGTGYNTRKVYKYGLLHSLSVWAISHDSQRLLVDGAGILLMTPLAVLAAWVSSKTFATLISDLSPTVPWPLASLFLISCFTVVCYYTWLVSATTRHVGGWWLWYRKQYEVHLLDAPAHQLQLAREPELRAQ